MFGAAAGVLLGGFVLNKLTKANRVSRASGVIMKIQLFVIVISAALVYSTSSSLQRREGLPVINQIASWAIICRSSCIVELSPVLIYFHNSRFKCISLYL